MTPNSIEWVTVYYALAKIGAVMLPVNHHFRGGEIEFMLRDSGAKAFIGHEDHLEEPLRIEEALPELRIVHGDDPVAGFIPLHSLYSKNDPFPASDAEEDDTAAIFYTSGTTGRPKGAMLTHKNLFSNAKTVADMRSVEPDDVVLGVIPLFHIYGLTSLLNASFYLSMTIRLWPHFEPGELLSAIEEEKHSILFAVPTILNRLLTESDSRPLKRSGLRFCISGASSLPIEVLKRFEARFETHIYEGYGLTECSPVCVENPFGLPTRPGSIGLPIPGFEIRVVNEKGEDVPVGEVGELLVKGPGVMKGYLKRPEATAEVLKNEWLHTGDLARTDEDGYIYIIDRKKDLIIRGGYNVYPREIEEVLYTHPDVIEAAVLGIPHPDLGEEVAAAVAIRKGSDATPDALRQFMKERVAPYKYPRKIVIMEELPKNQTGKIMKRDVRIA